MYISTWDFLVGMVVFLLMSLVNTPPRVSIPRERGVLIYVHLYLGLLGGDGGVPVDELGEHATQGLNTQGEGSHVQQKNVCHISSQHTT
jgi:hypothetical protein